VKRATGRSRHQAADPWNLAELSAVVEDLESAYNRLKVFAASLEGAPAAVDPRRARRRLAATRRKILSFVGELFAVQLRLQWVGEAMCQPSPPNAASTAEEDLDGMEQLLARIQCVLTDRLAPGIADLLSAARDPARGRGENE